MFDPIGPHEAAAFRFIEGIRDAGNTTATMYARALRNNVAVLGLGALAGAALALTAGDAAALLHDRDVEPNWTRAELDNFAADLATLLDQQGKHCAELITATRKDMAEAAAELRRQIDAWRRARRDLAAAYPESPAYDDAEKRMQDAALAAEKARRVAAECERAINLLEGAIRRVAYAHSCALRLPDDITACYIEVYELQAAGGAVPTFGWWFEDSLALADEPAPVQ
jgi:hypothetical protein